MKSNVNAPTVFGESTFTVGPVVYMVSHFPVNVSAHCFTESAT